MHCAFDSEVVRGVPVGSASSKVGSTAELSLRRGQSRRCSAVEYFSLILLRSAHRNQCPGRVGVASVVAIFTVVWVAGSALAVHRSRSFTESQERF